MSVPYSFMLAAPGNVSAAVYNAAGKQVRPLLYGQPCPAGIQGGSWDGYDRYGNPCPAGSYELRVLATPGFNRQFVTNFGVTNTWAPCDWYVGNHSGPTAAWVDAANNLFIGANSSEGPPALMRLTLDGKTKAWDTGTFGVTSGLLGLATLASAPLVVFLQMGSTLDIRWLASGAPCYGAAPYNAIPQSQGNIFLDLTHAGDTQSKAALPSPMGFAAGANKFVISYFKYNEVRFVTPAPGGIKMSSDITVSVPSPTGVCVVPDGTALAISGTSLLHVDPVAKTATPIISGLVNPTLLAFDAVNQHVLVTDGNCVRRYYYGSGVTVTDPVTATYIDATGTQQTLTLPAVPVHTTVTLTEGAQTLGTATVPGVQLGDLLATYGNPAGRTYGAFNPSDFGGIIELKADGAGGFVAIENYPRRVAHFDGNGNLINQWLGGLQWGSLGCLDSADPTVGYLPIDAAHLGRATINPATGAWTLTDLYATPDQCTWALDSTHGFQGIFPFAGERIFYEVRHVGGEDFLVNRGGGATLGTCMVFRIDQVNHRLWPVAFLGSLNAAFLYYTPFSPPGWWAQALNLIGITNTTTAAACGGQAHLAFSWSDTNGDGLFQVNEVKLGSSGPHGGGICRVDANWNVTTLTSTGWMTVPNEGTATAPVWNWDHAVYTTPTLSPSDFALHVNLAGVTLDATGAAYLLANSNNSADAPPPVWPNNSYMASRFLKINPDGSEAFSVGRHSDAITVRDAPANYTDKFEPPGTYAALQEFLAIVNPPGGEPVLIVRDFVAPATGWTADGLYAGSFYDDAGMTINQDSWPYGYKGSNDDNEGGHVIQAADGTVYWQPMLSTFPVFKIGGFTNWQRQSLPLTLVTSPPAPSPGTGLTAAYYPTADLSGPASITELDPFVWFGPWAGNFLTVASQHNFPMPTSAPFSVRWTGTLVPPVSEEFTFSLYLYGNSTLGSLAKLSIGGQVVVDAQSGRTLQKMSSWGTWGFSSQPLALQAGVPVAVELDFMTPADANTHCHLYWQSRSLDQRHTPTAVLHAN